MWVWLVVCYSELTRNLSRMYQAACRTGCILEWMNFNFFFFNYNSQTCNMLNSDLQILFSYPFKTINISGLLFPLCHACTNDYMQARGVRNKEGATFVHGALKNASQDTHTHTHSFPSPCFCPPTLLCSHCPLFEYLVTWIHCVLTWMLACVRRSLIFLTSTTLLNHESTHHSCLFTV